MAKEPVKGYVVCKRRNIAAAFERFLGPSAGALLDEPWHSRTWTGILQALRIRPSTPTPTPRASQPED